MLDTPKGNFLLFAERFHAPYTLKSTHDKVHRDKHSNLETFNKLPSSQRIAVTDASVHRKHHEVKGISYLSNVFKFTKESLFLRHRIDILTELFAEDLSFRCVVGEEACVPVA